TRATDAADSASGIRRICRNVRGALDRLGPCGSVVLASRMGAVSAERAAGRGVTHLWRWNWSLQRLLSALVWRFAMAPALGIPLSPLGRDPICSVHHCG